MTTTASDLQAVADALRSHDRFIVVTHENPDGDALGSMLAMTLALRSAGKVVPDNSQPQTTRRNDTAGTAFGLLPFLAAGITHKTAKSQKLVDYSKAVGKAIDWLMARQSKSGNDKGFYGGDMYSHGLATIAMCEAYGLTSDPRIKVS